MADPRHRYNTRTTNSKHPAQVVLDSMQKRRPAAEVALEKAEKEESKKKQEDTQAATMQNLKTSYVHEKRTQQKASREEMNAARPQKRSRLISVYFGVLELNRPLRRSGGFWLWQTYRRRYG